MENLITYSITVFMAFFAIMNPIANTPIFLGLVDGENKERKCPSCDNGRIGLKVGKFGGFVGCSNYPDCKYTVQFNQITDAKNGVLTGPKEIGIFPETGEMITFNKEKKKKIQELLLVLKESKKEIEGMDCKKGIEVNLKPGDMLMYRGCDLEHWREPFKGKDCGQVFLHYNDASGENAESNKYDGRPMIGLPAYFKGA